MSSYTLDFPKVYNRGFMQNSKLPCNFLTVMWKDCSQPSLHVVLCGPEMPDLLKDGTILSPWLDYTILSFMACQFCHIQGELFCV